MKNHRMLRIGTYLRRKETQEPQVQRVQRDPQGLKETQVLPDHPVLMVATEPQDPPEPQVVQVQQEPQVPRGLTVLMVLLPVLVHLPHPQVQSE